MMEEPESAGKLARYTLIYDLAKLPTVQHRAGLGGLTFLLRFLEDQTLGDDQRVDFRVKGSTLTLILTPPSILTLFEELYRSMTVTRTKTFRSREESYEDWRPAGRWLYLGSKPDAEELILAGEDDWHKLWQDSLWQTFRRIAATRNVFAGSKAKVVDDFWTAFQEKVEGKMPRMEIASPICVGAQDRNAEGVRLDGDPEEVFLLHFSQVLAQPYRAVQVDRLGRTLWPGTLWMFPDPRDLERFVTDGRDFLATKTSRDPAFRDRSRMTMPEEAALGLMAHWCANAKASGRVGLQGVYCAHLDQQGNSVNLLDSTYQAADRKLIAAYGKLVRKLSSFPMRRLLTSNLLNDRPMYAGAAKTLTSLPKEVALPQSGMGIAVSFDCKSVLDTMDDAAGESMKGAVGTVLSDYLVEMTRRRVPPDDFQGVEPGLMPEYPSTQVMKSWQSLSSELFFQFGSARTQRIFAQRMKGTVLSIPQREGWGDGPLEVIETMMQSDSRWEELKDVMLLSLSAHSYRREIRIPGG